VCKYWIKGYFGWWISLADETEPDLQPTHLLQVEVSTVLPLFCGLHIHVYWYFAGLLK
jgi:hypothetical protein